MIVFGLTGGIGSGKSTVAAMLTQRGAVLIDADEIAREVVEPGRPAHDKVVERFGGDVVAPDGRLDRQALAATVFRDPVCLADLESIVHPEVRGEIASRLRTESSSDSVVVLELPLFVEKKEAESYGLCGVLVVDAPLDLALERLVDLRQMDRADAEARIAKQTGRLERIASADFVIMNMGTLEELEEMTGRAWAWMECLRDAAKGTEADRGGTR